MWTLTICLVLLTPAVYMKSLTITTADMKRVLNALKETRAQRSNKFNFDHGIEVKSNNGHGLNFDYGTEVKDANFDFGTEVRNEKDFNFDYGIEAKGHALSPGFSIEARSQDRGFPLGGPATRRARREADSLDLDNLFAGFGIEARGAEADESLFVKSDVEDSTRFQRTLVAAAREFKEKREMEQKTVTRSGPATVTTCIYCDAQCVDQANSLNMEPKEYFEAVVAKMNELGHGDISDDLDFDLTYVLLPPGIQSLQNYFDYSATTEEELITAINDKFWKDQGLYDMAVGYGCDINYLAASKSDSAWTYITNVKGIAQMFQLCQSSYSTVEMNNSPSEMARLMFHEFGHMIGMYHDGELNEAYTGMSSYFNSGEVLAGCSAEYSTLEESCQAGNVGCASGSCIMSPTVDGDDISDCSIAYYKMFLCLKREMPDFYTDACVDGLPEV